MAMAITFVQFPIKNVHSCHLNGIQTTYLKSTQVCGNKHKCIQKVYQNIIIQKHERANQTYN